MCSFLATCIAFLIVFQLCETTCVRRVAGLPSMPPGEITWEVFGSSRSCIGEKSSLLDLGEEVAEESGE